MIIKQTILTENQKQGGKMRKRECRSLLKMDVNKIGKVWDFFLVMGWVGSLIGQGLGEEEEKNPRGMEDIQ
jgi:hypothetical protein